MNRGGGFADLCLTAWQRRPLLVCARCLSEWAYLGVVCVNCGEEKFDAPPVDTTDDFAHVRIEACDTCRRYLKTIDLTINGLAVPIVDDIASVPLDLSARDLVRAAGKGRRLRGARVGRVQL